MFGSPSSLERAAARNLVKNYLRVRPGENVLVETWDHTIPMASAMVDAIRRVGGRTTLIHESEDAWWRAVDRKQTRLLGSLSDPEWAALRSADAYVMFWGPSDAARLEKVPQKNLEQTADWFERWYQIARSTGLRGLRMGVGFVTDARARQWGVSRDQWMESTLRGCLVDPKVISDNGRRLARAFRGGKKVRITHPNGTDLEVGLAGTPSRIYEGRPHPRDRTYSPYDMLGNVPGGTFRIALDSKTAEGKVLATRRSYDLTWYPWATYARGSFEFSKGQLTSFAFEEGARAFAKQYARGKPGKDRTGSLSIGLNPKVQNVPFMEGEERGVVELTVGGNTYLGGRNTSDFSGCVCLAEAEVSVDGTPVVRSGKVL